MAHIGKDTYIRINSAEVRMISAREGVDLIRSEWGALSSMR